MTLRIGDVAPDFEAEATEERIRFHDWIGDSRCVDMSIRAAFHNGSKGFNGFVRQRLKE